MVEQYPASAEALDLTFAALANATRRDLLAQLATGEKTIGELATRYDTTFAGISKHLDVLARAGLVRRRRVGRQRECTLVAGPMSSAAEWLAFYRRFWDKQLDQLARYLESPSFEGAFEGAAAGAAAATTEPPVEKDEPWRPKTKRETPSSSGARSPRRPSASSRRGRNRRK
ncbi:MAG: winged helix-turn-helix transcriptional regulator [Gemmatimonadetes bacterium]|nr:winged helix-turn-helix transcriptional regulator [Gemmatimonadota bacterium]